MTTTGVLKSANSSTPGSLTVTTGDGKAGFILGMLFMVVLAIANSTFNYFVH